MSQAQQLRTPEERLQFLEAKTADGSLDLENVTEIAKQVQLPEPSLNRLLQLGKLVGSTPLFVPRFAKHRDTTIGAVSGFALRLREMMDKPAAASPQEAVKRVVDRYRGLLQSFGPRERTEWGLIVRLTQSHVKDPVAVEAGLENILAQLSSNQDNKTSNPHQHQAPFQVLQGIRRQLLLNVMELGEFDAVYRYSRDNAVNEPLRQHYGKDNIPGHVMATPRRELMGEPQNGNRASYHPLTNITTGHFIYMLDRALNTLRELQGQDKHTLYRATLFRKPWVDAMIQSGQFMDHGYVSTSRYTDKLTGFFRNEWATRFEDEVPVMMVFETHKGVDLSCLSRFTNESEHLIPREEKFQARFLGYRRDLCPGFDIPDSENWAVFVMTDDGHEPAQETVRSIKQLGMQAVPLDTQAAENLTSPAACATSSLDAGAVRVLVDGDKCAPAQLLKLMSANPRLAELYALPVGVSEGFTLGKHTQMVLNQFEGYLHGAATKAGLDKGFFRCLLALHDAGKPIAHAAAGDKKRQHEFTLPILEENLRALGFDEQQMRLASALVDGDPIGQKLLRQADVNGAAVDIMDMARRAGVPASRFLDQLLVFFMADASSYTSAAGSGQGVLDRVFTWDRLGRSLKLTPSQEQRITELRQKITQLERGA